MTKGVALLSRRGLGQGCRGGGDACPHLGTPMADPHTVDDEHGAEGFQMICKHLGHPWMIICTNSNDVLPQ